MDLLCGVDTDVYKPNWQTKNPFDMLWSSDPGRGLTGAVELAIKLYKKDKRFNLTVCYPDYVKNVQPVSHPAIKWLGNVSNSQQLFDLFNNCGIFPYTSTFKEPSSRRS